MPFRPSRDDVMRREVARFAAENGLVGRAARQGAQQAIIDRLGGGAEIARAAGFVPARRGEPGGKEWEAAKRAYQRARTGQQEIRDPRYLEGLRRAATPRERARLDTAESSKTREQIVWPEGAAVRVTVEAEYEYSEDERDRSDLWAELDGSELDRLLSAPWEAWDERKGLNAGGGGQHYMPGLVGDLKEVHGVRISWVSRGAGDLGTF